VQKIVIHGNDSFAETSKILTGYISEK